MPFMKNPVYRNALVKQTASEEGTRGRRGWSTMKLFHTVAKKKIRTTGKLTH